MKKGIFGSWFKELATLIFTQTIQAFLLAVVMTIIISALSTSNKAQGTYAAGLLAIIALSQFGKIELLVKNIFGVTSQFGGGMEHGKGGLLAGMAALKMGGKWLDNNKKMVGGFIDRRKAGRDIKNLQKQKENLNLSYAADDAEGSAKVAMDQMEETAGNFINGATQGAAMATGAQIAGGTGGGTGIGVPSSEIQGLISAIKEQTTTIKNSNSKADKDDKKDKLADLEKKINEAKQNKRAATAKMVSGLTEYAGYAAGGIAGGIVGLGMGENVVKNAAIGAGIGDMAVSSTINAGVNVDRAMVQKKNQEIDIETQDRHIESNKAKINKAKNEKQMYDSVTSVINKASESGYKRNASAAERAKTVEAAKKMMKSKYDASNM